MPSSQLTISFRLSLVLLSGRPTPLQFGLHGVDQEIVASWCRRSADELLASANPSYEQIEQAAGFACMTVVQLICTRLQYTFVRRNTIAPDDCQV
jgi:hypothetical protein